jgi:hypothetical protein
MQVWVQGMACYAVPACRDGSRILLRLANTDITDTFQNGGRIKNIAEKTCTIGNV